MADDNASQVLNNSKHSTNRNTSPTHHPACLSSSIPCEQQYTLLSRAIYTAVDTLTVWLAPPDHLAPNLLRVTVLAHYNYQPFLYSAQLQLPL